MSTEIINVSDTSEPWYQYHEETGAWLDLGSFILGKEVGERAAKRPLENLGAQACVLDEFDFRHEAITTKDFYLLPKETELGFHISSLGYLVGIERGRRNITEFKGELNV